MYIAADCVAAETPNACDVITIGVVTAKDWLPFGGCCVLLQSCEQECVPVG